MFPATIQLKEQSSDVAIVVAVMRVRSMLRRSSPSILREISSSSSSSRFPVDILTLECGSFSLHKAFFSTKLKFCNSQTFAHSQQEPGPTLFTDNAFSSPSSEQFIDNKRSQGEDILKVTNGHNDGYQ